MAWRPVTTQHGAQGYCGLAGEPGAVAMAMHAQKIEMELAFGSAQQHQGGRLVVPS